MINHISIAVHDTEKAAKVLAELWNGYVVPFPPCPNSFMVLANDGRGTAIEVTPIDTVLVPGNGLPPADMNATTPTEEYEAQFVKIESPAQYVATHININTKLNEREVRQIAERENWRVLVCNRAEGLFQLIELWIEDRLMLEVMTPEQTARYVEVLDPQFLSQAFGILMPSPAVESNSAMLN